MNLAEPECEYLLGVMEGLWLSLGGGGWRVLEFWLGWIKLLLAFSGVVSFLESGPTDSTKGCLKSHCTPDGVGISTY